MKRIVAASVLIVVGATVSFLGKHGFLSCEAKGFDGRPHYIESSMARLLDFVKEYKRENGDWPSSLSDLWVGASGAALGTTPLDPWGRPFLLVFTAEGQPMIVTLGEDGRQGGEGMDRDWSSADR